jgi:hypothetical protein
MRPATIHHRRAYRAGATASVVAAGLLLLAACGSGGNTASASAGGGSGSGSGMTVTVHDAGGMKVLATSAGRTRSPVTRRRACRSATAAPVRRSGRR